MLALSNSTPSDSTLVGNETTEIVPGDFAELVRRSGSKSSLRGPEARSPCELNAYPRAEKRSTSMSSCYSIVPAFRLRNIMRLAANRKGLDPRGMEL